MFGAFSEAFPISQNMLYSRQEVTKMARNELSVDSESQIGSMNG